MKKISLLIGILSLLITGCSSSPSNTKEGDTVRIIYTGYYSDNTLFETGEKVVTIGSGQIIKGIEEELVGRKINETITTTISPEKGYGKLYSKEKIKEIPTIIFQSIQPKIGDIINIETTGKIIAKEKNKDGYEVFKLDTNSRETQEPLSYEILIKDILSNYQL